MATLQSAITNALIEHDNTIVQTASRMVAPIPESIHKTMESDLYYKLLHILNQYNLKEEP